MNKLSIVSGGGDKVYEPEAIDSIIYTRKNGSAATLDFSLSLDGVALLEEGDVVKFYNGDTEIFYGRIISLRFGGDGIVNVVASDSIYYLRGRDSYNFINQTLSQIVRRIITDVGLIPGEISETSYKIPFLCAPDSALFSIIEKALYEEKTATGNVYSLYCDFDKICLKNILDMKLPVSIDENNTTGFEKNSSIDTSYNRVKLTCSNDSTGMEEKYVREDAELVNKWGLLQYHEKANGALNMTARADELLQELRKKKVTFEISGVKGNTDVKAGSTVTLSFNSPDVQCLAFVESVKHEFSSELHLMSMSLKLAE